MATEEDIVFRINYQLEGVERSISTSRRALFTLNAIRLSIRDIQQVLSGPTIANVLFTAIQLTRTLTQARRLTKALATEQAATGVASVLGAVGGRGAAAAVGGGRAFSFAEGFARTATQRSAVARAALVTSTPSFLTLLGALATANPIATGIIITTGVGTAILGAAKANENKQRKRVRERSREAAKAQGLEF